jgi:hypothetical protein
VALEGTIQDFALPDIFQLIGIQRKTGILTLVHENDVVTIKFLEGQVVEADTASASLESRLGTVLVRTGRISEEQLEAAFEIQRTTLQRLGHILVKEGLISQDELVDALQIQSSQVIYRLFRWRKGQYHFDAVPKLEYDQKHSTPMSSESILMEGARMVDEWPIIERRIPSDKIVFRRTEAAEGFAEQAPTEAAAPGFDLDLGLDLDLPFSLDGDDDGTPAAPEPTAASGIELSEYERPVLEKIDGRRSVREIVDLLAIPEFETFRAMSEMLTRGLIEKVEESKKAAPHPMRRRSSAALSWVAMALLALGVAVGLVALPANRWSPWQLIRQQPTTEKLRLHASMARLERIERAIRVFYLDAGTIPDELETLVRFGYLDAAELTDPWSRPYLLQVSSGGYQLIGWDAAGEPSPALSVSRAFSEMQRMLLDDRAASSAAND